MQPYFFPYIGYWQLASAVDTFVVFDDVNYKVRGWIHRNRILVNGEVQYFGLRIRHASQNRLINQTQLAMANGDFEHLLHTLERAYSSARHFRQVQPELKDVLRSTTPDLTQFLVCHLRHFFGLLGIRARIVRASEMPNPSGHRAQQRILDICELLGATTYINAPGGVGLYEPGAFAARNVDLRFVSSRVGRYEQFVPEFVPNLSIIDVLMHNGFRRTREMIMDYELVTSDC